MALPKPDVPSVHVAASLSISKRCPNPAGCAAWPIRGESFGMLLGCAAYLLSKLRNNACLASGEVGSGGTKTLERTCAKMSLIKHIWNVTWRRQPEVSV